MIQPLGYPVSIGAYHKGRRQMSNEHEGVIQYAVKMQLRKQGPWLILRLYHPDGCRFFDQFAGTITREDKEAITEDSQRLTSPSLK